MKNVKIIRPLSILFGLLLVRFKEDEFSSFICNTIKCMRYHNIINSAERETLMDSFLTERPTPTKNVKYYESKYYAKGSDIDEDVNGWWVSLQDSKKQSDACKKQRTLFLKMLKRKHKKLENSLVVSN